MNPERWQEIDKLLEEVLERPVEERASFLEQACGANAELRREVEALVDALEKGDGLLDAPAIEVAAKEMAGDAVTADVRSLAGQKLSHYEVISLIGAGGMGEVYRATDDRLGRDVAIKVLPPHWAQNPQARLRFEREAKVVASLSHPNILAIHELGYEQDVHFAVMELLDGENLRARLAKGPLPWREAIEIATSVADGLAAAHAKEIIHRDLKPENIFLTTDGRVKILDFGLARRRPSVSMAALSGVTEPGIVLGTVGYMSPEQLNGDDADSPSDIFSLGCVLYEMVSGRRAFSGRTRAEILTAVLRDQPAALIDSTKDDAVPAEIERIVRKCLEKESDRRYQSARELLLDLKGLQSPASQPAERSSLSRRVLAMVAGTVLVLAGVGISFFGGNSQTTGSSINSIAVLPFTSTGNDEDTEYLSDGITESLINTLSQLPELRVIARTTAFRYKGQEVDARKVRKDLNVGAVLTGRLVQRGDTLTMQVDLIDAATGNQLWGDRYTRKLADIFAAQDDIVRQISESLRLKVSGEEQQRLTKRYTENVEAYQLYLKGRYHSLTYTVDGMNRGLENFHRAIQLDPKYALAYAGLSEAYVNASGWYFSGREAGPKAKEAALKALALDNMLSEAHIALGLVAACYDWDWSTAEREFKRSIELNPGSAAAADYYAFYFLAPTGRTNESLAVLKRAQELDPLSVLINQDLATALYFARRYDEAIAQFKTAVELDPNFWVAHINLGNTYMQKAMYPFAIAEYQKTVHAPGFLDGQAFVTYGLAMSGKSVEAKRALPALTSSKPPPTAWAMAAVYAALGDKDQAFKFLQEARDDHFIVFPSLKVEPLFDSLRSDPRFRDLLRSIGL